MAAATQSASVPGGPDASSIMYKSMRMQRLGSVVIVQPVQDGVVAGQAVTVDLRSGAIAMAQHPEITKDYTEIKGLLGVMRLHSTVAMAVITGAEQVAVLRGAPVYQITGAEVLASLSVEESEDGRLMDLLEQAVKPTAAGRGMYYSHGADITLTSQRVAALNEDATSAAKPLWARQDSRFFWNRMLAAPLLEGVDAQVARFVPPVMMGMVRQLPAVSFSVGGEPRQACFTLIARRSVTRPGTRYWRRGIDLQGNVANFVETEQIIQFDSHRVLSSYVQVRGSMPVMWSQAPNIKYKPPTYMAPVDQCQPAFDKHIGLLLEHYKEVTALNLANQHGSEGKLGAAYEELARNFRGKQSGFRLEAFDFHKECGATNYDRLSLLWENIREDFARYGYYVTTPKGTVKQRGTFRTNCVDSLDRTNVVQGMLARHHLEAHLAKLGALKPGEKLATAYADFDVKFKNLWADHGDEVSNQYAGTGALKSQFTRTGKRDVWGLLDDGKKSGVRYLLNNYQDGGKQDALDLMTGTYDLDPATVTEFKRQPNVLLPLAVSMVLLALSLSNYYQIAEMQLPTGEWLRVVAQKVMFPVAIAGSLVALVFKFGRTFVNSPQLRPDLVKVWEKPKGAAGPAATKDDKKD